MKNRTLAKTKEDKTPFEIFFGIRPSVKHLKIYGSRVFVRLPENKRKNKWDDKAVVGVLVGYAKYGYRVLVKGRVFVARHVKVIENSTKLICLEREDKEIFENDYENEIELNFDDNKNEPNLNIENVNENDTNENANENANENKNKREKFENVVNDKSENENGNNLKVPRVSNRNRSPIQRYRNPVTHLIYVNFINANCRMILMKL